MNDLLENLPEEKVECVRHFLYFPTRKLAAAVRKILPMHGRTMDVIYSDYGANWLLLICDAYRGEDAFETERSSLMETTECSSGEYDGWEFEIRNAIH